MGRAESNGRKFRRCEYKLNDVHTSEASHIKAKTSRFLEVMYE